jgi:hypothetical protein
MASWELRKRIKAIGISRGPGDQHCYEHCTKSIQAFNKGPMHVLKECREPLFDIVENLFRRSYVWTARRPRQRKVKNKEAIWGD